MRCFLLSFVGFAQYSVNAEIHKYSGQYQECDEDIKSHWYTFFRFDVLRCRVVKVEGLFGQFVVECDCGVFVGLCCGVAAVFRPFVDFPACPCLS